jgi:uncharacterized protein (TIGR02391 family)
LADALCLLEDSGAAIDEVEVDSGLMNRVEESSVTSADLLALDAARRIRPMRWHDYVFAVYGERKDRPDPWRLFDSLMPLGLIDTRIRDLAKRFKEHPDEALLMAFRRLEELIRARSGSSESGTKLLSQCLQGDKPKLRWEVSDPAEQVGRAQLFTGAFQAFRNPRAHREVERATPELWNEFLLLNHLFCLESQLAPHLATTDGK